MMAVTVMMVPRISMLAVVILAMVWSSHGPRIHARGGVSAFVPNSPATCRIRQPQSSSSSALFGIKGFRGWFEKTFPSAVVPIPKGGKGAPPNEQHSESFDHVLIDANQLLHIAMRRSHSPSHALMLMIKELDKLLALAQPRRSVVLALDGPPSAAKLATQRSRRYGILQRGELHKRTLDFLVERGVIEAGHPELGGVSLEEFAELGLQIVDGWATVGNGNNNPTAAKSAGAGGASSKNRRKNTRTKLHRYAREANSLSITPGTDFLSLAESALLYWAWQRLSYRKGPLSGVRVYLSPSIAPGEGEVKLLNWLRASGGPGASVVLPGQSVAICGGDSDLVLEGLIIPPSITHNVFVILPDDSRGTSGGTRNIAFCVSLWETTRALARFLPSMPDEDLVRVRTDLVLLLIMNGNDYLPKLRGSSGFDKLFGYYLRLLREWLDDQKKQVDNDPEHEWHKHGVRRPRPFLVDPNTLEFNLPFCLAFFRRLVKSEPHLVSADAVVDWKRFSVTPLSQLNNLIEGSFLPGPLTFSSYDPGSDSYSRVSEERSGSRRNKSASKKKNANNASDNEVEFIVMTLGKAPSADAGEGDSSSKRASYYRYEIKHKKGRPMQRTKQILASMAIEELLGADYLQMPEYVLGKDSSHGDDEGDIGMDEGEEDDDDDDNVKLGLSSDIGYDWESDSPVEADVELYLEGLIWNLQTYQDGVCPNYGYTYGNHMSPTASELEAYLKAAMDADQTVGPVQLLSRRPYVSPLPAGMSCLAALPSQVDYLVPDPYRQLSSNGAIEDMFDECMERGSNIFDIERFRHLCIQNLDDLEVEGTLLPTADRAYDTSIKSGSSPGKQIRIGENFWTVLHTQPSSPPEPFSPPQPFSKRLSPLRPHNRIVARRVMKNEVPTFFKADDKGNLRRMRDGNVHGSPTHRRIVQERKKRSQGPVSDYIEDDVSHNDALVPLLTSKSGQRLPIFDVAYKRAYSRAREEHDKAMGRRKRDKKASSPLDRPDAEGDKKRKRKRHRLSDEEVALKKKVRTKSALPKEPPVNKDGQTPGALLVQLQDLGSLTLDWEIVPLDQSIDGEHEIVRLVLGKSDSKKPNFVRLVDSPKVYEHERNIHFASRKVAKHYLAACALSDFGGGKVDWAKLSFKDYKNQLKSIRDGTEIKSGSS